MADAALLALAEELGKALQARGWKLTLAESCTGGWMAQTVTAIAGSSTWFERGFVTYSDAAKQEMLAVSAQTLGLHGAVSEHTAREMTLGALRHSHANIAAAITGIAGPGGASADKPVGLVCFAWAHTEGACESVSLQFSGDREAIRYQSVKTALEGLLRLTLSTDL